MCVGHLLLVLPPLCATAQVLPQNSRIIRLGQEGAQEHSVYAEAAAAVVIARRAIDRSLMMREEILGGGPRAIFMEA